MKGEVWTAEEGQKGWRIRYDPTPGGRKNADGTTSYSMTFPALDLCEYVAEPESIAHAVARELNTHGELVEALRNLVNWHGARDTKALDALLPASEQTPEIADAMRVLARARGEATP